MLLTAVTRQLSGFEPSLQCYCRFFCFFLGVGEWVNGCLSTVLFTASVGLQMNGSLSPLFVLFRLVFRLFVLGG